MRHSFMLAVALAAVLLQSRAAHAQAPNGLTALSKSMESAPSDQRLAFNALLVAFTTFRDAHLGEICSGDHGCRETLQAEKSTIDAGFLRMAEGHPQGGFPSFTTDELAVADASLNESFENVFASLAVTCSGHDSGCLSQTAFRDIERDWIRYRDAWITYAALRWPQMTPESWLTLLTRERTAEIHQIPKPIL